MLASKIKAAVIENPSEYLGARIAAINLFQFGIDQPLNCLWYCYEKAPPPPLPPFWKVRGQWPRHSPRFPAPLHSFIYSQRQWCIGYGRHVPWTPLW